MTHTHLRVEPGARLCSAVEMTDCTPVLAETHAHTRALTRSAAARCVCVRTMRLDWMELSSSSSSRRRRRRRREGGGGEREEGDVWLGGKVKRRERERERDWVNNEIQQEKKERNVKRVPLKRSPSCSICRFVCVLNVLRCVCVCVCV